MRMSILIAMGFGLVVGALITASFARAQDVFSSQGCNNPYGCAHPSHRTGTQSRQPTDPPCNDPGPWGCPRANPATNGNGGGTSCRDVYCQMINGKPTYGPYNGTGRQIPCPPGSRPDPPPDGNGNNNRNAQSCDSSLGLLDEPLRLPPARVMQASAGTQDREWLLAQSDPSEPGLYIAGQKIAVWGDAFPDRTVQKNLFEGNSLRIEIFRAMTCNPRRRFEFASADGLKANLFIREQIVTVMQRIRQGGQGGIGAHFAQIGDPTQPQGFSLPATAWVSQHYPAKNWVSVFGANNGVHIQTKTEDYYLTWKTQANTPASAGIRAFLTGESYLECLSGVELVILSGVELGLDRAKPGRFDQLHSVGVDGALSNIGVPINKNSGSTINRHLILVRETPNPLQQFLTGNSISQDDLVPGDYLYMTNAPGYPNVHPDGGWAGENAIFMRTSTGRFYGFGLNSQETADQLKNALVAGYNYGLAESQKLKNTNGIYWTLLGGPVENGAVAEAGPYVR
jgi:hypothetical protein